MNQHKGEALLVVVATIITSILILMTDRDITQPSADKSTGRTENITTSTGFFDKISADKLISIKADDTILVAPNQNTEPKRTDEPIWVDKPGNFKNIEKSKVVFKTMPISPDGLQERNPKQVITNKADKFSPTKVSTSYNYQKMAMYNGGYYIAPMPSYLMPSTLPRNAVLNKKVKLKKKSSL